MITALVTMEPPEITLSAQEEAALGAGEVVHRQDRLPGERTGRGTVVQEVPADPATVWSHLLAFERYPGRVDHVREISVYERTGDHVKVHFELGGPLWSIQYSVDHVVRRDEGWMSWSLDPSQPSDFRALDGWWRVEPAPGRPGWSRVTWSAAVDVGPWIPAPLVQLVRVAGQRDATRWLAEACVAQ